jgi:hypothetical protein
MIVSGCSEADLAMWLEDAVVTSRLSRSLTIAGRHIVVNVFRGAFIDDDWFFEIIENENRSDVSESGFPSDRDALNAALRSIHALG